MSYLDLIQGMKKEPILFAANLIKTTKSKLDQ